ncbi:MAG TPA: hypothetical protein VGG63_16425 [Steroidobacteraceae bacterium]
MRSRFNANALMQRNSDRRDGEAFADYVTARKHPLEFWRTKVREFSRTASRHAFDSASDHEEAIKHLTRMANHIDVRGGTAEFDPMYMAQCFASMLKAMGSEDDSAEDDYETDLTAEERHRRATGEPSVNGEDDVGETPARSVVTTKGPRCNPDHRKDFNDIAEGGADSAYGFDANALFQRSER